MSAAIPLLLMISTFLLTETTEVPDPVGSQAAMAVTAPRARAKLLN